MIYADTEPLPAGTRLYRVADPAFGLTFKRTAPQPGRGGRFDCVDGAFGYTYFADEPRVALAEVFTRDLTPSTEIRTIRSTKLAGAVLQTVTTIVDLHVQLLHGSHLTKIGQTIDLTKSDPHTYPRTRAVAADLIDSQPREHGLRYRPRNDEDGFAYLLYATDPFQRLDQLVRRKEVDIPLNEGEGLETATLLLAHYNVSIER